MQASVFNLSICAQVAIERFYEDPDDPVVERAPQPPPPLCPGLNPPPHHGLRAPLRAEGAE